MSTWVEFELGETQENETLRRLLKKDRRAWVLVDGQFLGPESVHVDERLPHWMKELFASSKRRYGHMDSYETMIRVTQLVEVEPVASETPW